MAFDSYLAERIRILLKNQAVTFEERKMMGGLCFMVDDKMCLGLVFHKKKKQDLFMARIGLEKQKEWSGKRICIPMDLKGKTMKILYLLTLAAMI